MPIELKEESGGKILVIRVSGTLVKADYKHFERDFARSLGQHGKVRVRRRAGTSTTRESPQPRSGWGNLSPHNLPKGMD